MGRSMEAKYPKYITPIDSAKFDEVLQEFGPLGG
jgi:hypothetical protein